LADRELSAQAGLMKALLAAGRADVAAIHLSKMWIVEHFDVKGKIYPVVEGVLFPKSHLAWETTQRTLRALRLTHACFAKSTALQFRGESVIPEVLISFETLKFWRCNSFPAKIAL